MLDDRHEVMTIFGTDQQIKMYNIPIAIFFFETQNNFK
jgi:hypothetical protein